jgi:hypothetical protein
VSLDFERSATIAERSRHTDQVFYFRRLRPDVRSDHRFRTVREEDDARAAQAGQRSAEGRGRCDSRLDAQVLHAGGMGEEEGCAWILK